MVADMRVERRAESGGRRGEEEKEGQVVLVVALRRS